MLLHFKKLNCDKICFPKFIGYLKKDLLSTIKDSNDLFIYIINRFLSEQLHWIKGILLNPLSSTGTSSNESDGRTRDS